MKYVFACLLMVICYMIYMIYTSPPVDPETRPEVVEMKTPPKSETRGRFQVERVGKFDDGLAYGGERGIYVVYDVKTGREYVGVSGVGIAETGSHGSMCGKVGCSVADER